MVNMGKKCNLEDFVVKEEAQADTTEEKRKKCYFFVLSI